VIKHDINIISLLTLKTYSVTHPARIYYILFYKSTYVISYNL